MALDPRIEGFDADAFRDGIETAMMLGLPPELEDQPTFVTPAPVVDTGDERDVDGIAFDWEKPQTRVGPDTATQAPAAIEYFDADGMLVNFGSVAASKVVLTMLDVDYEAIKGFSYVVIAGNKYLYERTEPPLGMVDVAIWRIHCRTDDEG